MSGALFVYGDDFYSSVSKNEKNEKRKFKE